MFKRQVRATTGRRLTDTHRPAGVPLDVLYIVFALGVVLGVWVARSRSE